MAAQNVDAYQTAEHINLIRKTFGEIARVKPGPKLGIAPTDGRPDVNRAMDQTQGKDRVLSRASSSTPLRATSPANSMLTSLIGFAYGVMTTAMP